MSVGAIRETHINADEGAGYLLGEPVVYADLCADDPGELFRLGLSEFGACVGSIYVNAEGGPRRIGWVFRKRRPYEDNPTQGYLHEVWVELLERPDTVEVTSHPYYLDNPKEEA